MIRRSSISFIAGLLVLLAGAPAFAELWVDYPSSVPAGEPFLVKIETDESVESFRVFWLDRELRPEWWWENGRSSTELLLGMGLPDRLESDRFTLIVELNKPGGIETHEYPVKRDAKFYPEQHLEVSKRFSELSKEDLARSSDESALVKQTLATLSPRRWHLPFIQPVPGEETSVFGLRRFFNQEPKRSHGGLDLRAAEGDSVIACADGHVILTGDHFFAGKFVYIDHGQGVISMYFHLSAIEVESGQKIERGACIGRVGSTGRVTGPHLHWGVSILGQLVDPQLLLEKRILSAPVDPAASN